MEVNLLRTVYLRLKYALKKPYLVKDSLLKS